MVRTQSASSAETKRSVMPTPLGLPWERVMEVAPKATLMIWGEIGAWAHKQVTSEVKRIRETYTGRVMRAAQRFCEDWKDPHPAELVDAITPLRAQMNVDLNRCYMLMQVKADEEFLRRFSPLTLTREEKQYFAHYSVRAAVAAGTLERPSTCSKCHEGGDIHGHHADYDKPLEVEWLCDSCHAKLHHKLRRSTDAQ